MKSQIQIILELTPTYPSSLSENLFKVKSGQEKEKRYCTMA